VGYGPGDVTVLGVEVVVREAIAHPGDGSPRHGRFACQQPRRDRFHRLSDLDEANADRVVDQPVGQVTTLEVAAVRSDRVEDVLQPLGGRGSQRDGLG